jgi:hypothetical protein
VNELVTKEEPLYFNLPNLASLIAKHNSKKRGTSDSNEMQQTSTGSILIPSSVSLQELHLTTCKTS